MHIHGIITNHGVGLLVASLWELKPGDTRDQARVKELCREILHDNLGLILLESGTELELRHYVAKERRVTHFLCTGTLDASDVPKLQRTLTTKHWKKLDGDELEDALPWPGLTSMSGSMEAVKPPRT